MDSLIFQAMAIELNDRIANSRLDKVVQPSAGSLVLKLWTGQEKVQLLLKAEGKGAYYLSTQNYTAPAKPPRVCQLLRARLRRLVEVRAEPLDRIVHFLFNGPEGERYDLVLEAFGGQGNLLLVDSSGCIVDLLYRQDGKRQLLPGVRYELPEQREMVSLFDDTDKVVATILADEEAGREPFSSIAPISPSLDEMITLARQSGQALEAIVTRIKEVFKSRHFVAQRLHWGQKSGLLPLSLADFGIDVEFFADLSTMVETDDLDVEKDLTKDLAANLAAVISKQRKRLAKRKEHILAESERQSDPERYKVLGELLLANLHLVKRGDSLVEVDDYYQTPPEKMSIELDSKMTPQENAERYFKLYRKARRSGDHHARRLQETDDEIAWLDQVELSLEEAMTGDDLYQVQVELESAGMLKATKGQLAKRKEPRPEDQLYHAVSPAGWNLYWGKNSRTNDYVSRSMTDHRDFWFHAKGMPGSHLVLKCGDNDETVAEEDIIFAASYAAGYSKGKDAGKVEVIVAKGRDVKKPKGAKPGLVTVESYRSVVVAPLRLDA